MTQVQPRGSITVLTAALSALAVAIFAFVGGWQRRWISDDGLIVLRTVRNLLAGNGPVFNAGERVEANTSTLWQYCIYLVALVVDAPLETIALWLALLMTTVALGVAAWGSSLLHRGAHAQVLVPLGGIIYLTLPPARDFATSGLEWGLSLLWIAVLWWLVMAWVSVKPSRHGVATESPLLYFLALWCGLSWLARPELALYGGIFGLFLLLAARSWRSRVLIMVCALPIPAGYQIFRMGYYGLLTPHTAVAKSAGDSAWDDGWEYLLDLATPYSLFLALAIALVMAGILLARSPRPNVALRSPATVVALIVLAGTIHLLYVLRVGGDFMHGRMLLLPLFALLLPLGVIPLTNFLAPRRQRLYDLGVVLGLAGLTWWAIATIIDAGERDWEAEYGGEIGIVDERDFWTYATFREKGDPPRYATDFLSTRGMRDFPETIERTEQEAAAFMSQFIVSDDPPVFSWTTSPRMATAGDMSGLSDLPPTLYHLNLGMTSMNAPLEVRVLDTVGLSTPLAARQPRDPEARVGHDKWLPHNWQAADTGVDLDHLPPWYYKEPTAQARAVLQTPELAELFATYREPLSASRFFSNIRYALSAGRTLEFSNDAEQALIELGPVDPNARIAWPVEIKPEPER